MKNYLTHVGGFLLGALGSRTEEGFFPKISRPVYGAKADELRIQLGVSLLVLLCDSSLLFQF